MSHFAPQNLVFQNIPITKNNFMNTLDIYTLL